MRRFLPLLFTAACATNGAGSEPLTPDGTPPDCAGGESYPQGAAEPMALGEVISPYSWPSAIHRDGRRASIDLGVVPCNTDPDIDWSPFDVLLFVSIPAW
jgi:hypothetical protein